jgi:hypothetical protein
MPVCVVHVRVCPLTMSVRCACSLTGLRAHVSHPVFCCVLRASPQYFSVERYTVLAEADILADGTSARVRQIGLVTMVVLILLWWPYYSFFPFIWDLNELAWSTAYYYSDGVILPTLHCLYQISFTVLVYRQLRTLQSIAHSDTAISAKLSSIGRRALFHTVFSLAGRILFLFVHTASPMYMTYALVKDTLIPISLHLFINFNSWDDSCACCRRQRDGDGAHLDEDTTHRSYIRMA